MTTLCNNVVDDFKFIQKQIVFTHTEENANSIVIRAPHYTAAYCTTRHTCCQDSDVQDQDLDVQDRDQDQDFEFQDQDQDQDFELQDQDS